MELADLLEKPVNELSVEELELRLALQKKLNIRFGAKKAEGKKKTTEMIVKDADGNDVVVQVPITGKARGKTNKDKQLDNLIKGMSKEQLSLLLGSLGGK